MNELLENLNVVSKIKVFGLSKLILPLINMDY